MRIVWFSAIVAVLASALVLGACGNGKTRQSSAPTLAPPAATPTAVSDEAFKTVAEQAAKSTLLTLPDFPAGWSGKPQDHSDLNLDVSAGCREFFATNVNYEGSVSETESLDFNAAHQESVSSDAGVYRTGPLAEQAQMKYTDFFTRCRSELEVAFKKYLSDSPGIIAADAKFTDAPAPGVGDWSQAITFSLFVQSAAKTIRSDVHIASMRYGRVVASVSYTDDGSFDHTMGDRLVALVADRVSKADAALPD